MKQMSENLLGIVTYVSNLEKESEAFKEERRNNISLCKAKSAYHDFLWIIMSTLSSESKREKLLSSFLFASTNQLNLSTRIKNILVHPIYGSPGILSIGQLVLFPHPKTLKNMGRNTYSEVEETLKKFNPKLHLNMSLQEIRAALDLE